MSRKRSETTRRSMIRAMAAGAAVGLGGVAGAASTSAPETISREELLARDGVEEIDTASNCVTNAECTDHVCGYTGDFTPIYLRRYYECCDGEFCCEDCEFIETKCDCLGSVE